jgi:putative hydrolase of the HAD superfamily
MSRMAAPRVIFFDAADTLFHVKGSVGEVYCNLARKYGVTSDRDTIQQAFAKAFDAAPPPVFATQDPQEIKACERLWWFDVVHHVFYRAGMFEGFDEYFEEVFAYFSRPDAWELYEDTVSTLSVLGAREIEVGIVSNFDSRLYEILIGLGIDRFFESVTISSFAGAAKPSPKIFQRALQKHGVTAEEALHVGNSLRDDVRGAAAAGLEGVLLDRHGREAIPPEVVTIKSLSDVLTLVGQRSVG